LVKWLDGEIDVQEGAIPADEIIVEIGRVLGHIGFFYIWYKVAGPIQFGVGKRQVGRVVIGEGGIADTLEGRFSGLPLFANGVKFANELG